MDDIDDWFLARQFPHLYDPSTRPARWREAQLVLTRHFCTLQILLGKCPWSGKSG